MRNLKNISIAIICLAVVGVAINAFAYGGMGWGNNGGNFGPGYYQEGNNTQISQEDYEKLTQQRDAFLKDTERLRSDLIEKEGALRAELIKEKPDAAQASKLQKEVSELHSKLDQKRIAHVLEMRKLDPNAGRGFFRNGPPMGQGYGPMMNYGPQMRQGHGHMRGDARQMEQGYGPMMNYGPQMRRGHGHMNGYAQQMEQGYGPMMSYGPQMRQGFGPMNGDAPQMGQGYGPMMDDGRTPGNCYEW